MHKKKLEKRLAIMNLKSRLLIFHCTVNKSNIFQEIKQLEIGNTVHSSYKIIKDNGVNKISCIHNLVVFFFAYLSASQHLLENKSKRCFKDKSVVASTSCRL